jgi:choline-sulfatase
MLRRGKYKYSHYFTDTPELYDLGADPNEMRNLSEVPEYRSVGEELRREIIERLGPVPKLG